MYERVQLRLEVESLLIALSASNVCSSDDQEGIPANIAPEAKGNDPEDCPHSTPPDHR